MARYLVLYAEHFGLMPHAQLSTNIHRAEYIDKTKKWEVEISPVGGGSRVIKKFDKVIYAMGPDQVPNIPKVPGIAKFKGDVTHSIGFKEYGFPSHILRKLLAVDVSGANKYRPESWAGKRVLVVGFGNTAADIAGVLVGVAKHVYLSHRSGAIVVRLRTDLIEIKWIPETDTLNSFLDGLMGSRLIMSGRTERPFC